MKLVKVISIVVCFVFSGTALSARNSKIELDKDTLAKINTLLGETTDFQKALYEQDSARVKKEILELNNSINMVLRGLGDFQVQNQGMHLKRILQSTQNYLETYQNINRNEKKLGNFMESTVSVVLYL